MWPDQVSHPGPLTYESGAPPTALRGPAFLNRLPDKTRLVLIQTRPVHVKDSSPDRSLPMTRKLKRKTLTFC